MQFKDFVKNPQKNGLTASIAHISSNFFLRERKRDCFEQGLSREYKHNSSNSFGMKIPDILSQRPNAPLMPTKTPNMPTKTTIPNVKLRLFLLRGNVCRKFTQIYFSIFRPKMWWRTKKDNFEV